MKPLQVEAWNGARHKKSDMKTGGFLKPKYTKYRDTRPSTIERCRRHQPLNGAGSFGRAKAVSSSTTHRSRTSSQKMKFVVFVVQENVSKYWISISFLRCFQVFLCFEREMYFFKSYGKKHNLREETDGWPESRPLKRERYNRLIKRFKI